MSFFGVDDIFYKRVNPPLSKMKSLHFQCDFTMDMDRFTVFTLLRFRWFHVLCSELHRVVIELLLVRVEHIEYENFNYYKSSFKSTKKLKNHKNLHMTSDLRKKW